MTPEEMVQELTEYFSGNYGPVLLRRLTETCSNIPQEERRHVIEVIEEDNAPNFKCGVKAIADVCRKLSIPFHKSENYYVPAEDWTCDACGLQFKYAMIVSYDDKHDRGIHDKCPRCGMTPSDTIYAREIAKRQRGKPWPRYDGIKKHYLDSYRTMGHWIFDKKEDDDYVAKMSREEIEVMKQDAHDEIERVRAARTIA